LLIFFIKKWLFLCVAGFYLSRFSTPSPSYTSIQSSAACGDSFEGVAIAAAMYHKDKVRAFLGPYCSQGV
jgi:hypothetical protein